MARDVARDWMWSEALEMLARAERMHRDLFKPAIGKARQPAGARTYPPALRTAVIHRLELPQGRFYRRLRLPAGRYSGVRHAVVDGCLVITLQKAGSNRG
jgi:HSP20 family protein